jgi:hypothetical protein
MLHTRTGMGTVMGVAEAPGILLSSCCQALMRSLNAAVDTPGAAEETGAMSINCAVGL